MCNIVRPKYLANKPTVKFQGLGGGANRGLNLTAQSKEECETVSTGVSPRRANKLGALSPKGAQIRNHLYVNQPKTAVLSNQQRI